jgi:hypothetical protein
VAAFGLNDYQLFDHSPDERADPPDKSPPQKEVQQKYRQRVTVMASHGDDGRDKINRDADNESDYPYCAMEEPTEWTPHFILLQTIWITPIISHR